MKAGQGNVKRDTPKEEKTLEVFKPGDLVALTEKAMKSGPRLMSPKRLFSVGWPNEFQVVHVFETDEDGVCLFLNPCCQNLINHGTGAWACQGHPVKWEGKIMFEKTKPEVSKRPRKAGDRSTSITVPFLGEIGAVEYLADDEDPGLVLRVGGQQTVLKGIVAKTVAQFAKENGIL